MPPRQETSHWDISTGDAGASRLRAHGSQPDGLSEASPQVTGCARLRLVAVIELLIASEEVVD